MTETGYITTYTNGETVYIYSKENQSACNSVTLHNFGIVDGKLTKIF